MGRYRKIDSRTVAITTTQPASYFPYMAVYILFTSPPSFERAGRDWGRVATLPAAGTGPFRITAVRPREEPRRERLLAPRQRPFEIEGADDAVLRRTERKVDNRR